MPKLKDNEFPEWIIRDEKKEIMKIWRKGSVYEWSWAIPALQAAMVGRVTEFGSCKWINS